MQGALDGGALICRAKAAEAVWYNPAGVVRGTAPEIQGNVSVYELDTMSFEGPGLSATASTMNTLPAFAGKSSRIEEIDPEHGKLAWGYCIVTPVNWNSAVSSYDEFTISGTDWDVVTTSTQSRIGTLAVGASVGYARSQDLCFGGSVLLYSTSINLSKSRYDGWSDGPAQTWTWSSASETEIGATHLGFALGVYWRPREAVELGLIVRSPGIKLSANGTLDEHRVVTQDDPPLGEYEYDAIGGHDEDVPVDWRIPLEVGAGVALRVGERAQLEVDLNVHAGTGTYEVFPEGFYEHTYGTIGGGGSYVTEPLPRPALTTTGNAVANLGVGFRYEYVPGKKRLHVGLRTSRSPVSNDETEDLFDSVDLTILTVGTSAQTERTFASMGVVVGFGSTEDFKLLNLQDYSLVSGRLAVTTIGFVLGASFKF